MLGHADPDEMLAGMSERTFQKWLKFFGEEPFGPQVENLMLAQIAAAASWGSDPSDFLPLTVEVEPEESGE